MIPLKVWPNTAQGCKHCSTYVQRMFNVCSAYVQRMFNVCSTYVQRTYVQRMFNVCSTYPYVQHMFRTYVEYTLKVQRMFNVCTLYNVCSTYVQRMFNVWFQVEKFHSNEAIPKTDFKLISMDQHKSKHSVYYIPLTVLLGVGPSRVQGGSPWLEKSRSFK